MSSEFDSISVPDEAEQDTADATHVGSLPATEVAADAVGDTFDPEAAVAAARNRLDSIDREVERQKRIKAQAQAEINGLGEERKRVARFVSASTPRTRKPSK